MVIGSFSMSTVNPRYTVLLYLVNSRLQCLVITNHDSIYGKKNSQIWYPLVLCFLARRFSGAPVRWCPLFTAYRSATTTISLFPRFLGISKKPATMLRGHHNNQSLPTFFRSIEKTCHHAAQPPQQSVSSRVSREHRKSLPPHRAATTISLFPRFLGVTFDVLEHIAYYYTL